MSALGPRQYGVWLTLICLLSLNRVLSSDRRIALALDFPWPPLPTLWVFPPAASTTIISNLQAPVVSGVQSRDPAKAVRLSPLHKYNSDAYQKTRPLGSHQPGSRTNPLNDSDLVRSSSFGIISLFTYDFQMTRVLEPPLISPIRLRRTNWIDQPPSPRQVILVPRFQTTPLSRVIGSHGSSVSWNV